MPAAAGPIEPSSKQLKDLASAALGDERPIVMVNLLAFRGGDGRASYTRYAREVQPHLERVGAQVIYAGDRSQVVVGDEEGAWWDTILLVRYPSRAKFLEMVGDPGYREISVHRTAALEMAGLVATNPWPAPAS